MLVTRMRPFILSLILLLFTTALNAQTFTEPLLYCGSKLFETGVVTLVPILLAKTTIAGMGMIPLGIIAFLLLTVLFIVLLYQSKCNKMAVIEKEHKILAQKNASKDKFFSIIGHDLKSPFNSLMGLSEMLVLHSETMNQTEVLNYSKMVHQSTGKLFALVENLLQWSRTQMGTTDYKPEKLDLNILTGNVVNLLRLSAQEKDIVIALKMTPNLLSYADANIYSTVLRNLVGNAIKFSRVGSIIHIVGRKKNDTTIEVEVVDSGIGMNSDQLEKVFKIESAYSTVGTFNEKGTGLGLILSKEFVELNRGTISISSKYGDGTTVRFTVPAVD